MATRTMIFISHMTRGLFRSMKCLYHFARLVTFHQSDKVSSTSLSLQLRAGRTSFQICHISIYLFTLLVISMFHSDASITKDGTEMATITKQNFVATLSHNFLRLLHVVDLWTETLYSVERLGPIEEFNQLVWTLG